jgi:patatin-like phospholipase/acyl hydrolase
LGWTPPIRAKIRTRVSRWAYSEEINSNRDINPFYLKHGPGIFPQKWSSLASSWWGPKYDGAYLRAVVREELGETRVGDTLTNVVIPTFDVKLLQPIIFSTYDVRTQSPLKFMPWCLHAFLHVRRPTRRF